MARYTAGLLCIYIYIYICSIALTNWPVCACSSLWSKTVVCLCLSEEAT